ncbi:FxsA family protein [Ornithinibacillus sp. 4-3]|uniref:FxsA family protein n=1 Tax=Ornithinibacillus sp. 4-3 TaxID=3231488 RepID=A0AB39HLQ2_9BACI
MRWLIATLIIFGFIEVGLLIWVGQAIGPWWVLLVIFLTGVLGIYVVKKEGKGAWLAIQQAIRSGRFPLEHLLDGLCILLGGVLLLSPGFIADLLGIIFIIPFTRKPLKSILEKLLKFLLVKRVTVLRR